MKKIENILNKQYQETGLLSEIILPIFTYEKYLKYKRYLMKKTLCVCEETEEYLKDNIHQEHDKTFRKILEDKEEAAKFINKSLKLKKEIEAEEIEKYNTRFITKRLRNEETDIIYKLKRKNIFFLIEHQTKIDYKMPFRILQYERDIIESAIDKKKLEKKEYKLPKVITTVLYTGVKEWDANKYIKESQEKLEGYEEIEYGAYHVIDINKYTKEELLKEETFLSKAMLIEKERHKGTLGKSIEEIIEEVNKKEEIYNDTQRELLITIIGGPLAKTIGEEKAEELIEKIKNKKEEENMLAVYEMIEKENKRLIERGRRQGIREGRRELIKEIVEGKGGEEMRAVYEMIEKENKRLIEKGRNQGIREGIKEGKIKGISEGIVIGINEGKIQIAKKMKQKNISIDEIAEITDLSKEEIEKL